tara:strand:- start:1691 stop:1948 length:258 start_codon:yes stop_codon:yes gene_type:complete
MQNNWKAIKQAIKDFKAIVPHDNTTAIPFISSLTSSDRLKYHLDIPIELLSNYGCTSEGKLKKTMGMDAYDLKLSIQLNNPRKRK